MGISSVVTVAVVAVLIAGFALLAQEESCQPYESKKYYDMEPLEAPKMSGFALKAFTTIARLPAIGSVVMSLLTKKNHISTVRSLAGSFTPPIPPLHVPSVPVSPAIVAKHAQLAASSNISAVLSALPVYDHAASFRHWSIKDYNKRYLAGTLTPTDVARALIAAVKKSNSTAPSVNAVLELNEEDLLAQAEEATRRFKAGASLGLLDGVPVGVKSEINVKGYVTTVGTSFLKRLKTRSTFDSITVGRLRQWGAMLVGGLNMHEIGIGVTGQNVHYGATRNPYNLLHHTGGSSAGSAASVAAGFFPLTIGSDGGGSIRMPSSFCGVYGLKATFGRIPAVLESAWTVTHEGPIAASVEDLAIAYIALAGKSDLAPESTIQPPVHLSQFTNTRDLSDVRIGIFSPYFEHADSQIVAANKRVLTDLLEARGARVKEIFIPDMSVIARAHGLTILSELATTMDKFDSKYFAEFSHETQSSLNLGRGFTSRDYIAAQQIRNYAMRIIKSIFNDVDVIVTPATGITAPKINPDASATGEVDLASISACMRFIILGNFLGLPAVSVPIGYDSNYLPIAMQFMGDHWSEDTLFRLTNVVAESFVPQKPEAYFGVLGEQVL